MKEQLVSFETAKLAKEKGFDIEIYSYFWDDDGDVCEIDEKDALDSFEDNWNNDTKYSDYYSRPTQSLLQKWLRDIHNIDVQPVCNYHYKLGKQYYLGIIFTNTDKKVDTIIIKETDKFLDTINRHYNSYEEALEKGLQEALKVI